MQPAISVKNVSKKFNYWKDRPTSLKTILVELFKGKFSLGKMEQYQALSNVSFDIMPGEFVGIMGRNGAGKSTLLKIMSGIYQPTTGAVNIVGSMIPLIELGAGFHGDLSGYENIFLNAAILGFGRAATFEALPRILEFAELGDKIYMPTKNYSSGMLVRLGFSIACQLDAPVILIDEVLAVGDAGFQRKCLDKINELHNNGKTIVLVTHSPEAVLNHCQRCILIENREKVFDGPPSEGIQKYLQYVGG